MCQRSPFFIDGCSSQMLLGLRVHCGEMIRTVRIDRVYLHAGSKRDILPCLCDPTDFMMAAALA
jgi:hypothetical protein